MPVGQVSTPNETDPFLTSCARRLAREAHLSDADAARSLDEVVRFLSVAAETPGRCAPAAVLDEAWHVMVLDTRGYADFCRRRFGAMVHHAPAADVSLSAYRRARTAAGALSTSGSGRRLRG
jgi:hypothetical protein